MSVEIRCRYTTGTYVATAKGQKMTASNTISARQAAEALVLKMDLGAGQLQELPPVLHGIQRFQFLGTEKTVAIWSSQKPAFPGAYWIRGNGLSRPALIEVVLEQEQLLCNLHDRTTCDDFGFGFSIEQLSDEFEFLGPLYIQGDTEEVDQWKATAEHFTGVSIKAAEEVARLRTQLAEQHGLLSSAYSDMEHANERLGQCISCDELSEDDGIITHDPACTFCAMEMAIHATAEPSARDITTVDQLGMDANCPLCHDVGSIITDDTGPDYETASCPMCKEPSVPAELVSEDDLRDLASSACQEAFSFGVNEDVFMRLARSVELRARSAHRKEAAHG